MELMITEQLCLFPVSGPLLPAPWPTNILYHTTPVCPRPHCGRRRYSAIMVVNIRARREDCKHKHPVSVPAASDLVFVTKLGPAARSLLRRGYWSLKLQGGQIVAS